VYVEKQANLCSGQNDPIAIVEGKIQIRKPPDEKEAEEILTSAQAFLRNVRKYIEEYKARTLVG